MRDDLWLDTQVETLRQLRRGGKSWTEAGRALNVSKNAVIGKVGRLRKEAKARGDAAEIALWSEGLKKESFSANGSGKASEPARTPKKPSAHSISTRRPGKTFKPSKKRNTVAALIADVVTPSALCQISTETWARMAAASVHLAEIRAQEAGAKKPKWAPQCNTLYPSGLRCEGSRETGKAYCAECLSRSN